MNPAGMFNQTVSLYIPDETHETDASVSTELVLDSDFKCSLQPLSSSESIQYERKASGEFARLYCGASIAITKDCEVQDAANVRWRVVGQPRNTGGRSVFLTVDLERLK